MIWDRFSRFQETGIRRMFHKVPEDFTRFQKVEQGSRRFHKVPEGLTRTYLTSECADEGSSASAPLLSPREIDSEVARKVPER